MVHDIDVSVTLTSSQVEASPRVPLQYQPEEPTSASPHPHRRSSSRPARSSAARECSAAWLGAWLEAPSATAAMARPLTRSWRRPWESTSEWGPRGPSGVCLPPACLMILSSGSMVEPRTQRGFPGPAQGSTPSLCPRSPSPPCLAPGVFWPQLYPQPCP